MTTGCKNGGISDLGRQFDGTDFYKGVLAYEPAMLQDVYHDDLIARDATLGGLESTLVRRRSMNTHEMLATNS